MKYSARGKTGVDRTSAPGAERSAAPHLAPEPATDPSKAKPESIPADSAPAAKLATQDTAAPKANVPSATSAVPTSNERSRVERRRWERISLAGKRAFATIGNGGEKSYRVLDMSHGGVALEAENDLPAGEPFQAVLHVPILGEVRVKLKKLYTQRTAGQQPRVGCLFVT